MQLGGCVTRSQRAALALVMAAIMAACGGADGVAVDAAPAVDAAVDADVDAAACSREPCSILPQCGCDEDPERPVCDLDFGNPANGDTACRGNTADGDETTVCTRPSTCGPEHICVGRCARHCDDDDDCAGPGGLCILPILFQNQPIPGIKICTTDCDPSQEANATCPAGWACHLFREADGDRRWLTNCEPAPAAGGALGDACTTSSTCKPGLDCFSDGTGGRKCFANCRCPGGDCTLGVCPPGTGTCRGYSPPAMIGADAFGRCFDL